ncbi:MAG TPA: hypothetical protein VHC71_00855 [Hyphomicrobium sp.]|nr:hypothetical protein [Hyphomicrobium sp.]
MKVYVVYWWNELDAVFSTEEKATAYAIRRNKDRIARGVDGPPPFNVGEKTVDEESEYK